MMLLLLFVYKRREKILEESMMRRINVCVASDDSMRGAKQSIKAAKNVDDENNLLPGGISSLGRSRVMFLCF